MDDFDYLIGYYDEASGEVVPDGDVNAGINHNKNNLLDYDVDFMGKKHSFIVFLLMAKNASIVILLDRNYITPLNTFYLDKYGCSDIGYKRSQPLFLNEELLEKAIDSILSGDFANPLRPID